MMTPDEITVRARALSDLQDLIKARVRAYAIGSAQLYYGGHVTTTATDEETAVIRDAIAQRYSDKIELAAAALQILGVDPTSVIESKEP